MTLHVSTDPASEFDLELYSMGYYGGDGAREVVSVTHLSGTAQPDPRTGDGDLKYCQWTPAIKIPIPADWLSGVYLGKHSLPDQGPQSYVVFTRRDEHQADVVIQVSDFTWQAYNRWPAWNSLYDYEGYQWETKRSDDIGFDRPYARYRVQQITRNLLN